MKRLRHPIRAIREPFGTAGLVVACVALIAALGGTAFAAAKLNSTQKKEVEKIAKKYAGVPGAPGPAGSNGTNGTNGSAGSAGAAGKNGESVTVASASVGECANGGTKFSNGTGSGKACSGAPGAPGESPIGVKFTGAEEEAGSPPGKPCHLAGGVEYEVESTGDKQIVCNGSIGQDAGFNYVFSSNTELTDPGTGKLKLNNAAPGSAKALLISKTDGNGNGLAEVIKKWISGPGGQGTILLRKAGSPATFAEYTIVANNATDFENETEFDNVTIAPVASHGAFANGDPVTVAYWSGASAALPAGATETGTWAFSGTEAENGVEEKEYEGILVPISFSIPSAKAIPRERVFFPGDAGHTEHCGTSASAPTVTSAEYEGVLKTTVCFYLDETGALHNAEFLGVWTPELSEEGMSKPGGVLQFKATEPGLAFGVGAWAVKVY
jgi:hypothetical protein